MTTTTLRSRASAPVLDRAVAAQAARRRADVEMLEAVLAWAHAHPVDEAVDAPAWLRTRP